MSPIVRHGYSTRPNKDSWQRARNRKHIIGTSLLDPHAVCALCNHALHNGDPIEADHIVPISLGGSDELHNLRAVHRSCNRKRGQG